MNHMVQKLTNLDLEIILILLKTQLHLRAIANNLGRPHATILRRVGELLKKNIIDFKVEGKNKVFFMKNSLSARNYILMAEHYKLDKVIEGEPKLKIILKEVIDKSGDELIVLFGSYVKNMAKKESDIDLYVNTKNKKLKSQIESIDSRINVKIGSFDLNSLLIKEIIKNHVIIKGVEKFYEQYKFFEEA